MRDYFIQGSYIVASVLFIMGLRSLTRPDKARRGMQQAAVGMLLALCGTLMNHQIVDYRWIAAGLVLGTLIGYPLGMWVPTTALPQRIAMSLSFGALAATLVGVAEYYSTFHGGDGQIGAEPFRRLFADARSQGIPLILETPQLNMEIGDDDPAPDPYDLQMMALLDSFTSR